MTPEWLGYFVRLRLPLPRCSACDIGQACLTASPSLAGRRRRIDSPVGFPELDTVAENIVLPAPRAGFEPATYCLGVRRRRLADLRAARSAAV